jgi:FERM/RhoGEF/pleckstrin domain protein 2
VNLLEADYFGLEYAGTDKAKYWLDMEKPMNRQLELSTSDPLLRFAVKFYPPDPAQLEEEFTRYLFCMQIKQDLAHGVLQCNDNTAALIASYLVQGNLLFILLLFSSFMHSSLIFIIISKPALFLVRLPI